VKIWLKLP